MADYNVQMKQYNGTSFDNILPYASQALTLAGGGGATEIIAQARAGLSQIATGSYVGTGTYGQNNPIIINCGFRPKMALFYTQIPTYNESSLIRSYFGAPVFGWMDGITKVESDYPPDYPYMLSFTPLDNGLSFFGSSSQYNNVNGITYRYIVFG